MGYSTNLFGFSNMLLSAFQRKSWLEAKDILKKGYKKIFYNK